MVNIVDLMIGQQTLLGLYTLSPSELQRADVAPVIGGLSMPDGQFTVGDLLLIQQKALGLPSVF
ncbi:MAG: hypothetical protein KAJ95_01395 [Gammaproteobacteria bacterium]|nr:hypothetical protein [Gammaproteobacteria bacterium]